MGYGSRMHTKWTRIQSPRKMTDNLREGTQQKVPRGTFIRNGRRFHVYACQWLSFALLRPGEKPASFYVVDEVRPVYARRERKKFRVGWERRRMIAPEFKTRAEAMRAAEAEAHCDQDA